MGVAIQLHKILHNIVRNRLIVYYPDLLGVAQSATVIGANLSADEIHAPLAVLTVKRIVFRNVDGKAKRVKIFGVQRLAAGGVATQRRHPVL